MGAVIGRWERLRALTPRGLSAPLLLDRRLRRLMPLEEGWVHRRGGLWYLGLSGGVGLARTDMPKQTLGTALGAGGAQQTIALDSTYTAGTGGDAIAMRIVLPTDETLTTHYFFITGYTGTASLVDDINWEIRTGTASAPGTTAPDLVASGTVNPLSATGWISIPSLSVALTAGTIYWLIIGDADGNITNFATVLNGHSNAALSSDAALNLLLSASTTNGWSTVTRPNRAATLVARFSSGRSWGSPFAASAGPTSTSSRKGLRIDGLTEQLAVWGWAGSPADSAISGIELFSGTVGPGGTPEAIGTQYVMQSDGGTDQGAILATAFTLSRSTVYRFVFTFSAAAATPRKLQISTGAVADLQAAMLGASNWYYAEANGTVDWANDDTNAFPHMAVLIADQVQVTGGAGDAGRIIGS